MGNTSKKERRKKVIEVLNKARAMELQAIHQYINQHYNLDDMDYGELAAKIKLIAINEMRHAEMFAERIKELGASRSPGMTERSTRGRKFKGCFRLMPNWRMILSMYITNSLVCRDNGDSISMKIFEDIIDEEQIHYNYFDNVNGHIKKLGDTYLAKIAGTSSSTGLGPSGLAVSGEGE